MLCLVVLNLVVVVGICYVCGCISSGFVVEIMIEVADQWWVSLKAWFKWWVLFGVDQVGCGVEIAVWCGGNQHGTMVAMENRHGAMCVAQLLASMVTPLVVFFFFFFWGLLVYVGGFGLV